MIKQQGLRVSGFSLFCIWRKADRPEILNLTEIIWTIDCQHASESLLWTLYKKIDWLLNSYKPMSKTMLYHRYITLFPTVLYVIICLSNKVIHIRKKEINSLVLKNSLDLYTVVWLESINKNFKPTSGEMGYIIDIKKPGLNVYE